jgi:hypothetical protein
MDLKLLVCTAFYALGVPFRLVGPRLGVPGGETVEGAMRPVVGEEDRVAVAA